MRHLCQAHARPAHARNHHHHTTTASLHPFAMAVLCVNQQPCTCTRNRAHPIDACHCASGTTSVRRAVPHGVTSDRGRRSYQYTIDIFSFSPHSPAPHAVCVVAPALAKTRADRKVFQLGDFADRARRVHARACVCASERLLSVLHAE